MLAWIHDSERGRRRVRAIFKRHGVSVVRSLDNPRAWTLAHQPSGRKFPHIQTRLRRATALAVARALADLGDWSKMSTYPSPAQADTCRMAGDVLANMFGAGW